MWLAKVFIFASFLAGVGVSTDCRDSIFLGAGPFSESETRNVASLFYSYYDRVVSFLSVHSYTQLLLHPWGYVNSNTDPDPPKNLDELVSRDGARHALGSCTKGCRVV